MHYFSNFVKKHKLWLLVRKRLAEAVLTSTHNLCLEKKYEKYRIFYRKIFLFLVVKFSIYLNRRVFVMEVEDRYADQTYIVIWSCIRTKVEVSSLVFLLAIPLVQFFFVCASVIAYVAFVSSSRKHAYINLTPLNPTFIQKIWGLQGYTLFFLFLL